MRPITLATSNKKAPQGASVRHFFRRSYGKPMDIYSTVVQGSQEERHGPWNRFAAVNPVVDRPGRHGADNGQIDL